MAIGPKEAALRKQREERVFAAAGVRRPRAIVAALKEVVEKAVTKRSSTPLRKAAKKKRPKPKPKTPATGRPRVYETSADRQRAYRERKAST